MTAVERFFWRYFFGLRVMKLLVEENKSGIVLGCCVCEIVMLDA